LEKVKISGLDFCRFSCGVYPNDFEYFVEMWKAGMNQG
jgi:hypothetical protein